MFEIFAMTLSLMLRGGLRFHWKSWAVLLDWPRSSIDFPREKNSAELDFACFVALMFLPKSQWILTKLQPVSDSLRCCSSELPSRWMSKRWRKWNVSDARLSKTWPVVVTQPERHFGPNNEIYRQPHKWKLGYRRSPPSPRLSICESTRWIWFAWCCWYECLGDRSCRSRGGFLFSEPQGGPMGELPALVTVCDK